MSVSTTLPAPVADALVGIASRALRIRWLMRAPVRMYRARLGFLFGSRMLMLEHTGRKTGARRYVILEVIDHPDPDSYVVVSGFGARAQWFRNVRADPGVRVWIGGRRPAEAYASLLNPDESAASLHAYVTRHPRTWATMKPAIESTLGAPTDDRGTGLPMVRIRLT
ncbi:nitroreductase family deazaflavin-dependent oxidoreductase [Nocardia flavorosea]|uniref:Nitroreductase family deazaflavin-dependent oxidoreductase n=1 Tax=Nocardia flavorosea TaxID=53429 RepID=A0A846YBV0_9NOCA|nr:nitroreductase family deazaflavin-dependent oxidoreductase [Nocardia flavorosea]NKY57106.1 nitroreductase family deazaflavin-dependent oxidoreductase [Nocardia flavorosea]